MKLTFELRAVLPLNQYWATFRENQICWSVFLSFK